MKFRFVFVSDFDYTPVFHFVGEPCESKEEARKQADMVVNYTLSMPDSSNYFYIEELVDGEWVKTDDLEEYF